jgi:integrase
MDSNHDTPGYEPGALPIELLSHDEQSTANIACGQVHLIPTLEAIPHLSPQNQELVATLVRQLAQREGIQIACSSAPGLQTPAEGIPIWLAHMKQERMSRRTIECYLNDVKRYLRIDPYPTKFSITKYLAERLDSVSSARVHTERKALKSFFSYLYEEGLWPTNPLNGIRCGKVTYGKRKAPPEGDVWKLLQAECFRKSDTPRFRMLMALLVDTGLRISEAASIERANIDLDRRQIKIVGKGNKPGVVPISPIVAKLLGEYLREHCQNGQKYLFPGQNKLGYWDVSSIEKTMKRLCRYQGIPNITPHQLRHFFATYARKRGAKIEVISRILRHASVAITLDIYRDLDWDEVEQEHLAFSPFAMQPALPEGRTVMGFEYVQNRLDEAERAMVF